MRFPKKKERKETKTEGRGERQVEKRYNVFVFLRACLLLLFKQ